MANVAMSSNDLSYGPGVLLVADQGTPPPEELGFHADPITISASREIGEQTVENVLAVLNHAIQSESLSISGAVAQVNINVLERLLGVEATADSIVFGGGNPQPNEVSLRLVTTTKDKRPMHILIPRAISAGSLEMAFGKAEGTKLPFEFTAQYDTTISALAKLTRSTAVQSLTAATDAVARVNANPGNSIAWLKISGESAAADNLADITAAGGSVALTNGEIVRVQIASATMPITIKHASTTLETKTAADFVMTKLADWIDLYYDLSTTCWKEIARYDAP